jgi:hypothetical protein
MPYTPPSKDPLHQNLPRVETLTDPSLGEIITTGRNNSPYSVTHQRPALPRSISSTSYLSRHHRSPSTVTADNTTPDGQVMNHNVAAGAKIHDSHEPFVHGNIRNFSSPINTLKSLPGVITTPPDSSEDEEEREVDVDRLKELREALLQANSSYKSTIETPMNSKVPASSIWSPPTKAGNTSHSRSSSEIALPQHAVSAINIESRTDLSGNSDTEDVLLINPPLLRKKTGELVKPALRPLSRQRRSSMPDVQAYSKAVHFNENIEQVRHFLQVDRPFAISSGSSPIKTYDSEDEYPFDDSYRPKQTTNQKETGRTISRLIPGTPRSQRGLPSHRPRSMPFGSSDEDFESSDEDFDGSFKLGTSQGNLLKLSGSSNNPKHSILGQAPRRQGTSQAFSSRYDFGASLAAALSNNKSTLSDQSEIKSEPGLGAIPILNTRPDTVITKKPDLQSDEYKELIEKYCFVCPLILTENPGWTLTVV